jgi:hypothetical protein
LLGRRGPYLNFPALIKGLDGLNYTLVYVQ